MALGPRIALIHALRESVNPIVTAFAHNWPEARIFNVLDDSLSSDLAEEGRLTSSIIDRFISLGRYARRAGVNGRGSDAILFTCSAFGPAIAAVKEDLDIPVLSPNEAAFEEALQVGAKIGLMVTFQPSMNALTRELLDAADARGMRVEVVPVHVDGALAALQAGDAVRHDKLIGEACRGLGSVDCVVLGQFSMARAASALQVNAPCPIITTPDSAVLRLRAILAGLSCTRNP